MKTLALLSAILLVLAMPVISQTVIVNEDFESAPYDLTSSGSIAWGINSRLQAAGAFSDSCTIGLSSTSYLTSNSFSTVGNMSVILEFKQICKIESSDAAQIEYSIDGGTTWTLVSQSYYLGAGSFASSKFSEFSYPTTWMAGNATAVPQNTWWKSEQFDLSGLCANQANVKIRFKLNDASNNGASQRTGWYLDDVKVTVAASELIPPTITLVPVIHQDTVFTPGPFEVKAKATDASGIASVKLVYSVNAGPTDTLDMSVLSVDTFSVSIPAQAYNTRVDYYVIATDASLASNDGSSTNYWLYTKKPAPVVIIGTGTTTSSYTPAYGTWDFGWSEMIYTPAEIGMSGSIDSIFFNVASLTAPYTFYNQKIYISTSAISEIPAGTMPDTNSMTLVYSGNYTFTSVGWNKVVLSTPFNYDGIGNLHIIWVNRDGAWVSGGPSYNCTSTSPVYRTQYKYADDNFPTTTGTTTYSRPNLKLAFTVINTVHNVAPVQMTSPLTVPTPVTGTPYDVKIKVKNLGSDTLNTLTINWSVNGTLQTPYSWNGTLLQDEISTDITLGSVTFSLVGNNVIKAWTSNPDGFADEAPQNDTISKTYFACSAVLAGTYTINPIVPTGGTNFQYFSDVLSTLQNCGITDTTIFNIVAGTYDTLLTLGTIPGNGPTASVVFQSASGINTDVTLRYNAATAVDNFVFKFNAAKYIEVKNMTIKALGTTYGKCVDISGGSNHLLFEGNIFENPANSSTLTDMALINNTSALNDTAITIRNNVFNNGSYGIYFYGVSSSLEGGNIIEGNTFNNFYYRGIYTYYQKNLLVHNNTLTSNTVYSSPAGMQLAYSDYSTVTSNKISVPAYYGLYFYYSDGDANKSSLIANNFISIGGSSTSYGLYPYYSNYVDIYHNTVNNYGSGTSARAFYLYYGGPMNVKDNVFAATGGGYAYYVASTATVFASDYNNLYSTGTSLGYYSIARADLAAWTTATLKDSNSVSINPGFVSSTNLHTFNLNMNDLGTPVGITTDIDGQTRSLITPDMGADEFSPAPEDAGVIAILEPTTSPVPVTGNLYNVIVEIKNFGTDTLETASIGWSVDGTVQTPFAWIGNVLPGATESNITIGTVTFPTAGSHSIKAWTSMPNAVADPNNLNDTTIKAYTVCDVVLSGTYSIDPVTPTGGTNFQYFAEVLTILQNCGISDTTVFNIEPGTYDTTLTFNGAIPGAGPSACVIFQSATGVNTDVTLRKNATASGSNFIVKLNGTSRVQFKNMSFLTQGTSYGTAINLGGGSHYNLFEGNIIEGPATTLTSSDMALIYNSITVNDTNNIIRNNVLNNGSYGIYWYGISSTNLEKNNVIEGNTLNNFYYYGLYTYYQKGIVIKGNELNTNSAYGSVVGMYLNYNDYSVIEKNNIVVPTYYGIYFYYCDADATTHSRIVNNMIQVGGTSTAYALYSNTSTYVDIYHNTLNTSSTSTTGRALYIYYGGNLNVKNNFLTNTGLGYAIYNSSAGTVFSSDYNNLYTAGSTLGYHGSAAADLAAWKTLTQKDSNSVSVAPGYISASDLHTLAFSTNGLATPLGITEDIDDELRSLTTPDMGADEFLPPPFEAQLLSVISPLGGCGLGVEDVIIRVKNNGSDTINGNFTATYVVNNGTPVTEAITATLLPMETYDFTFAATVDMYVGFGNDSLFNFDAWVTLLGDTIHQNDSISFSANSLHSPAVVTLTSDTIPYGTAATLTATSVDTIQWFADPALTTLLATGSSYTTPVLYDTTIYYVASTSAMDINYTFDSDLQGWTAISPCSYSYNWSWSSDGGAGAAYMPNPSDTSSAYLKSPVINVSGDTVQLSFRHRYDTENCCDRGYVAYRIDGGAWTHLTMTTGLYSGLDNLYKDPILGACVAGPTVGTFGGSNNTYFVSSAPINLNGGLQLEIAFVFSSDYSLGYTGWFIDEVSLHKSGCPGPISPDTVFLTGVPANDLGVISIIEPTSGIELTTNEPVQVQIRNYGTAPAVNFDISYQINSLTPVTEQFTGTILPGDTGLYTFTTDANLFAFASYVFKAYPTITGDIYPTNDTAYKTVTNGELIYCTSTATSTIDEDIFNVTIGSLNNTSPAPHTMMYTDYTTTVAAPFLAHGVTYPMSVTIGDDASSYYDGFVEAYIDFNHDAIFSDPEEIVFSTSYVDAMDTTITRNVTIPLTAFTGKVGMRVVCREGGTAVTVVPCGTYSYGETEDYFVILAPQIPFDAGVISIDEPGYIQSEASSVPVVVSVKNFGTNTLTSIPVTYEANSGTPVTYTWNGSLAPDDTIQITLPNVTVIADSNLICAYTMVLNDSNTFNDQSCAYFFGLPPTVIFEDDMENGTQLYGDTSALWEHGVPTADVINIAHSPDNVWATILDGDYPSSANGFVYTPNLNFFGVNGAYLAFYYWIDAEENSDGGFVQYTTNNGVTWTSLGGINDPLGYNWFDSFASGTAGWTKATNGWKPAFIKLDAVSGFSIVKFRFGFKSNTTTVNNGFAIDDVKIFGPPAPIDGGVVEVLTPSISTSAGQQVTVSVKITNFGSANLTSIPVSYALNTGFPPQNGTWTGTLAPGDTTTYTFTQTYPGPAADYALCAYTKLSGDPYKLNDTTCVDLLDATGIEETVQEGVVLLQNVPNPASDITRISFILPEPGTGLITLRNAIGEVIYSCSVDGIKGKNDLDVNLQDIEQGLYFYTFEFKDVKLTRRLSVMR
ncbi:MAG: hypothetical protein A2W93_07145 [Bacteroidetes bacterium GWF2_43_63]|nr:MAG: hypothetical protein A2W94_09735 [Bacteroidetes bacterium GWE2_42_42]OFY53785.1 MAG: hypothetical protein A2W93_07145 [Bacteroidetes bacterium GWF2_43_63]HCB61071.1 hypothetical protein [Bacteroidales bacterium]HCY24193.1 hypothetical protein [Bacteroidales bacterium]